MLRNLAASLALLAVAPIAHARPSVTIGEGVPFTAGQLADAVSLRTASNANVRVTRSNGALVVQVGDASQTVVADDNLGDPYETARVVALVVVALVEVPATTSLSVDEHSVPNAPATATGGPWSIRGSVGMSRDDGGTFAFPLTGALSYKIAGSARLVGSATLGKATSPTRDSVFIPLKVGIEGRSGALGIEVGGMTILHKTCSDTLVVGAGAYATGRVYLPIAARTKLMVEAGGYYAFDQAFGCDALQTTLRGEAYGGHFGAGVEWAL